LTVDEGVQIALRNVRLTFELRWNPKVVPGRGSSFDANGQPRDVEYEGRWELWDRDGSNIPYRVMILMGPKREYMAPDMKFVDFICLIDPARYGGSVERMIAAMVDSQNDWCRHLNDREFEHLVDGAANYYQPHGVRQSVLELPPDMRH